MMFSDKLLMSANGLFGIVSYRYAGYEYIKEIGIYDLNARYYNPEIAIFLSADPYFNLGNRVIGLYEINVPNAWSIIQANNIYVYILEGSTSSEIKIASVYDGNILFENSFDLHQSESSSLLRSFAQQYGKLVASNCRPHTYTYRNE